MKYNILSISILFSSLMIQGCKPGAGHVPADCETIYVDIKNVQEKLDAGFIIDTTYYDFVALETTPECLIAETTKIHIRDNKILIYDEVSHGVFIFTMDGKFHAKIHHIGNGPSEYPPVVNDIPVVSCLLFLAYLGIYSHTRTYVWHDTDSLKKELREILMLREEYRNNKEEQTAAPDYSSEKDKKKLQCILNHLFTFSRL